MNSSKANGGAAPLHELTRRAREGQLANHYHYRNPVVLVDGLRLQTISHEEAAELAGMVCTTDFQGYAFDGDEKPFREFARLIIGLASYEDHEGRQMCAWRVVQEIARWTKAGDAVATALCEAAMGEGGAG